MSGTKKIKLGSSSRCSTVRKAVEGVEGNLIAEIGASTSIITGANAGIGKATAQHLAYLGGTVVMACRSMDKANAAIEEIRKAKDAEEYELSGEDLKLIAMELDLGSLQSVQTFAQTFSEKVLKEEIPPLRLMVLNAGIFPQKTNMTDDGLEMTFQVNHFGHFLLTKLLLKNDPKQLLQEEQLRIVVVSSESHKFPVVTKKVGDESIILSRVVGIPQPGLPVKKKFSGLATYGSSKLCNVYFAQSLDELDSEGSFCNGAKVSACSLHPGFVKTEIIRDKGMLQFAIKRLHSLVAKDLDQGSSTNMYCSLMPDATVGGKYFSNCKVAGVGSLAKGKITKIGRDCLWKISEDLAENYLSGQPFQTAEPEQAK